MKSIFLSYEVSDELFVSRLVDDLKNLGYQVWQDCLTTLPEKTFLERLLSVRKRIDFILLIFSNSSGQGTLAASYWNDAIIDEAIHGRNWLIPVLIQDTELPTYIFPHALENFRDLSNYSSALHKLIARCSDSDDSPITPNAREAVI